MILAFAITSLGEVIPHPGDGLLLRENIRLGLFPPSVDEGLFPSQFNYG